MEKFTPVWKKLLDLGQRYLKTDIHYLVQGGSWLTFGRIIASGSAFLLAIAFANLLPPETYGTYRYVLSMFAILSIPALGGINTAVIQAIARGQEGSFFPALKTKIYWGFWGSLGALLYAGYYYVNNNISLTVSFLILAFFLPFMDSFALYDSVLAGKKDFKRSTQYFVASQLTAMIILFVTIFFTDNIYLLLLAYLSSWTLARALCLYITKRTFRLNDAIDPQTIPYGKHLSFMGIISTVANYVDKLLVFHFIGAAELAAYSIATAPPDQIKSALQSAGVLALPKFSERKKEDIKESVRSKSMIFLLIVLVIIAAYILAAPFVFKIFFPKYLSSIVYSELYALALIGVVSSIPLAALQATSATKDLYKFNIYTSLAQILLLVAGVYWYGLMGAILARILTRIVIALLSLRLFFRS